MVVEWGIPIFMLINIWQQAILKEKKRSWFLALFLFKDAYSPILADFKLPKWLNSPCAILNIWQLALIAQVHNNFGAPKLQM